MKFKCASNKKKELQLLTPWFCVQLLSIYLTCKSKILPFSHIDNMKMNWVVICTVYLSVCFDTCYLQLLRNCYLCDG